MFKAVDNLWPWFIFRAVGLSSAIGFGTWPLLSGEYEMSTAGIIAAVSIGSFLLLWFIIKPSYFSIELYQGTLYVSTERDEDKTYFITIPVNELAKYELKTIVPGLRYQIVFYKNTQEGYWLKSKTLTMAPIYPGSIKRLKTQLEKLIP